MTRAMLALIATVSLLLTPRSIGAAELTRAQELRALDNLNRDLNEQFGAKPYKPRSAWHWIERALPSVMGFVAMYSAPPTKIQNTNQDKLSMGLIGMAAGEILAGLGSITFRSEDYSWGFIAGTPKDVLKHRNDIDIK